MIVVRTKIGLLARCGNRNIGGASGGSGDVGGRTSCSNSAVTVTAEVEEICGSSTVVDMIITKTYKHAKKVCNIACSEFYFNKPLVPQGYEVFANFRVTHIDIMNININIHCLWLLIAT